MSFIEDYNSKIEEIKKITDDQIKVPHHIPVGIYVHEAENLYTWCKDDKEELMAKGFNWKLVEDLPVRCGALREAESQWQLEKKLRRRAEKIRVRELSKGYALRNELSHHFKFAFRKNSVLKAKVKEIAERSSNAGMIQGLNDFNVLGRENQELLTKIGFDFTLLDLAAQKSNELGTKKETASFYSEDYLEAKKIRDQAYTHLKEAVDLIYALGKYVFSGNPSRLKGYRSNHIRKSKRKRARKAAKAVPGTETGFEMVQIDS